MSNDVPVRTLLVTVTESIAEVFILCLAGYVLSRAGVTDKATQRKLNVINVSLFTPALLFSKVAYSLTPAKLKEMWIIPLGFFVVTGMSAAVAWILSTMFGLKKSQRAFAMCAAMFQNSNSLPIALIQSLVLEVPGLKWGKDDTKDQMLGRALTYLVLYSTLGMMFRWSWGVKLLSQADDEVETVKSIPVPRAEPESTSIPYRDNLDEENGVAGIGVVSQSPENIPHPGARETDPFFSTNKAMSHDEIEESENPFKDPSHINGSHTSSILGENGRRVASPDPSLPFTGPGSAHSLHPTNQSTRRLSDNSVTRGGRSRSANSFTRKKPTRTESGREFWGLPQFPKEQQRILLEEEDTDSEDEDEPVFNHHALNLNRRRSRSDAQRVKSFAKAFKAKFGGYFKAVNDFMTVPMYAALLSIFIALIPPLQHGLQEARPLTQAIGSAGACSIPVTLVVLGAFFYTPPSAPQPGMNQIQNSQNVGLSPILESPTSERNAGFFERKFRMIREGKLGNPEYPGENRTVFVAVISRMIITPLLLLPVIALLAKYDLFEAAEDPVFILSATLLISSPPALTLAQITQAASGDAFERLISKTISWSYAVLTPPLTLAFVVIGLVFGRL